jgi:hypothetical protein
LATKITFSVVDEFPLSTILEKAIDRRCRSILSNNKQLPDAERRLRKLESFGSAVTAPAARLFPG